MLSKTDRDKAADLLLMAEKERKPVVQLSKTWPDITIEDAYAISTEVTRRKILVLWNQPEDDVYEQWRDEGPRPLTWDPSRNAPIVSTVSEVKRTRRSVWAFFTLCCALCFLLFRLSAWASMIGPVARTGL